MSTAPLAGLQVGTAPGGDNVATAGTVQPQWRPGAAPPQLISEFSAFEEVYISLAFGASQAFAASVASRNSSAVACTIDAGTDSGTVTIAQQAVLRVRFACLVTSVSLVDLTVALAGADTLNIQFAKTCRTSDPHTGFYVATYDARAINGTADVVRGGETAPLWLANGSTSAYVTDAAALTFFVYVAAGSQDFTVIADQGDQRLLSPVITSGISGSARGPGYAASQITIAYV